MVLMSQKDVNIKAEINAKIDTIFDTEMIDALSVAPPDPSTVPVLNSPVMSESWVASVVIPALLVLSDPVFITVVIGSDEGGMVEGLDTSED